MARTRAKMKMRTIMRGMVGRRDMPDLDVEEEERIHAGKPRTVTKVTRTRNHTDATGTTVTATMTIRQHTGFRQN